MIQRYLLRLMLALVGLLPLTLTGQFFLSDP
jgi:hypothetical protein